MVYLLHSTMSQKLTFQGFLFFRQAYLEFSLKRNNVADLPGSNKKC